MLGLSCTGVPPLHRRVSSRKGEYRFDPQPDNSPDLEFDHPDGFWVPLKTLVFFANGPIAAARSPFPFPAGTAREAWKRDAAGH